MQPIHDPSRNPSRQPLRNLLLNPSRNYLPNPSCTLLPNHRSVHHATQRATIAQLIHNPPRNTWRNTSRKQPRIPKELGGGINLVSFLTRYMGRSGGPEIINSNKPTNQETKRPKTNQTINKPIKKEKEEKRRMSTQLIILCLLITT